MFHLRLTIDIQLRGSYKNVYRRLCERTSESRARGVRTSVDGTFSKCPYTNLKSMASAIRIFQLELDPMVCSHCVQLNVHGTLNWQIWCMWRRSAHYRRRRRSKNGRNFKNRNLIIFNLWCKEQIEKAREVFHSIGDDANKV